MNTRFNFIVNTIAAASPLPIRARPPLLRACGLEVHRTAVIGPHLLVGITRDVRIGEGVFINARCVVDGAGSLAIEPNVWVGMQVGFFTTVHEIGEATRRAGPGSHLPIRIESGAWIGAKSAIFGGVTVGRGAVVGAGSVVRKDVPPNTVVAGVPARVVRTLED